MKVFTTILVTLLSVTSFAQEIPFDNKAIEKKIITLSKGKYLEIENNDSLQRIGSVIVNRYTGDLYELLDSDTLYNESNLHPTIVTRWWSVDPKAGNFPWMSPYTSFDNNPIVNIDPTGEFSIKVVQRDDGKMELQITNVGYVKGQLTDRVLSDFHAAYPNGYVNEGRYVDNTGVEWVIKIKIDMDNFSNYDPVYGSTVDSDCIPPSGMLEWGVQGGTEVCAGAAGLALHGLWHNVGGDDCYGDEGAICDRVGLLKNPDVNFSDYCQIGYNFIDKVPENLNNTKNVKQLSVTGFIQTQGTNYSMPSTSTTQFFWSNSYPGPLSELVSNQYNKMADKDYSAGCESEGTASPTPSVEYSPGVPVNLDKE